MLTCRRHNRSSASPHAGRQRSRSIRREHDSEHRFLVSPKRPQIEADVGHGVPWTDPNTPAALWLLQQATAANNPGDSSPNLPETFVASQIAPFLRFDALQPNQLYVVGGRNEERGPLDSMEMFDTWNGNWVPRPRMSKKRAGCGVAALPDGSLMVCGGYDERGIIEGLLSSVEVFDPAKDKWSSDFADMSRARWGHGCASLNGKVYAIGGCSLVPAAPAHEDFMETLRECEMYDDTNKAWSSIGQLNVARGGARVTPVAGKHLVVVGGCDDVFGMAALLSCMEIYDPVSDRWTLLNQRMSFPRTTAAVAAIDDKHIMVFGGSGCDDNVLSSTECIEIASGGQQLEENGAASPPVRMLEGRKGGQAVIMDLPADGKTFPLCTRKCAIIVGGEHCDDDDWLLSSGTQLGTFMVYDIELQDWRTKDLIPPSSIPRTAAGVCVSHGRIPGHL